jgi:hypothetical protein
VPVKISKVKGKKCFKVKTPNATHAKCTSKKNAKSQQRLLNAIDHGFKPDRAGLRKRVMKSY